MSDQEIVKLEQQYTLNPLVGYKLLRAYQREDGKKYYEFRASLGYIAETLDLPLPSEEQTKNFLDYVSTAHSWYKHLDRKKFTPFYFYLDPYVMMIHHDNGSVEEAKERGFHYSTMPTSQYRQNYGYWNYFDSPQPTIRSASGANILIPELLTEAGTALVTASMYGKMNPEEAPHESTGSYRTVYLEEAAQNLKDHQAMYQALQNFLIEFQKQRQLFKSC